MRMTLVIFHDDDDDYDGGTSANKGINTTHVGGTSLCTAIN